MQGALLGPEFPEEEVRAALDAADLRGDRLDPAPLARAVAERLAKGQVVGLCQGRMEFGPRALGNRTILADARDPGMQRRVNAKVKFREGFRPFAPVVLAEEATSWFELDRPSPYMLLVVPVASSRRTLLSPEDVARTGLDMLQVERSGIPAVTHVDLSARVQTASPENAAGMRLFLEAFAELTGCPVLLNTSFNLRGEPIVCSPDDAVRSFLASGLDVLVLGSFLVDRPPDRPPTGVAPPPPPEIRHLADSALRRFGFVQAATLLVLSVGALALGGRVLPALLVSLSLALAILAVVAPRALSLPEAATWRTGRILGRILAGASLWAVFALVLTPLGLVRRFLADPLSRRPDGRTSFWEEVAADDSPASYERMY